MNTSLRYGQESFQFQFNQHARHLAVRDPEYSLTREGFVSNMAKYLPQDTDKYINTGIILSDKTRLCGYPEYLPWLTDLLEEWGKGKARITFYIAYGTHPKQTEEESIASYGETYRKYKFTHHDCNDAPALTRLGTTKRGTPVIIRKDVLESTLLITFGAISHHYFAGYGGGRKLLFPGLADRKAVYRNHSYFLDLKNRELARACQPGVLTENPIAEDLKEIDSYIPPKISIHGILNSKGKVSNLLVGSNYEDFMKACKVHDEYYRSGIEKQYDLVVASSGGYPKDINFIQGHKSIHHSAAFVRDGGKLIVLCECRDGIGSNYFTKFLEPGSFSKAFDMLETNYEGNGGTALSMMTKTGRIKIYMVTALSADECKLLNVTKLNIEEVQPLIDDESGSIAVIGNASLLVK